MERRLAAILAADVVGYSKLMEADEEGTLRRLTSWRKDVLASLMALYRGRLVKAMGDGFLIEFASVVDAVECALAWIGQQAAPFDFRIGINLGDIILQEGDIFGEGVNVAARIESLAEPGGVCISADAWRQARGKAKASAEDLGLQRLKNIEEPVQVYKLIQEQEAATSKSALAVPDKPSIAVLPFENLSSDPEQVYFSDGVTEDIITELSRFAGLFVIARNSSFSFKGKGLATPEVAGALAVRYVLEGSVRRAGNRLRITAQLVDREGGQIWAERYDRELVDVFDLQEEITRAVVGAIAPQIELAEIERSRGITVEHLSAYDLSLRALGLLGDALHQRDTSLLTVAEKTADKALQLDPRNGNALWVAAISPIYRHLNSWHEVDIDMLEISKDLSERFIRVDSSNPDAYLARGCYYLFRHEFDSALNDLRRALFLSPNYAKVLFILAWGESLAGDLKESREHAEMGFRLSPRDQEIWLGEGYLALTQVAFAEGDYEETRVQARKAIASHSGAPIRWTLLIAANAYLGESDGLAQMFEHLKSFAPNFIAEVKAGKMALYRDPEPNERWVKGLELAESLV